jgi:hypothetical protein
VLSYGGVKLTAASDELAGRIERGISAREIWEYARLRRRDGAESFAPHHPERPVKIGALWWPWGASRWATFHGLVTDAQLARVRQLVYAAPGRYRALELVVDDRRQGREVRTDLFMLPPRPLSQIPGGNGLWLLTLVDDRYFWWERSSAVSVAGGTTTWAQLLAGIAAALGVTLAVEAVPAAYLKPATDLAASYDSLPPLLDAALASVGQRLVRRLDGTVLSQGPVAAVAAADRQAETWKRKKGGAFALGAAPHDLQAALPARVDVVFPRNDSGLPSALTHTVSVALASLALPEFRGVPGHSGAHVIKDGAAANFTGGGTPVNDAELNLAARQAARDWYRWKLSRWDVKYNGIAPWVPEGGHDIEWVLSEAEQATRVQRSEGELHEPLSHHGTFGSGGFIVATNQIFIGTTVVAGPSYFTGSYTLQVVNNYTFSFGTSTSLSVAPPGVFLPPYITVNGAPTYSPSATAYQWVQTNTGFYFWNGTSWQLQGFPRTGWRILMDTATNSLVSGTAAAIDFDDERYDDDDYHDNSANPTRVTIPFAGRWSLGCYLQLAAPSPDTMNVHLWFLLNGATTIDSDAGWDDGGDLKFWIELGNTDWEFAAGDYVEVMVEQTNSGAAVVDVQVAEFWGHRCG